MTEQDRQRQQQYDEWMVQQAHFLNAHVKHYETQVARQRKAKKSLNAKSRQVSN